MMGAAGMRSAQLPKRATLDLGRVRFLLRLFPLPGFGRTHALFDSDGGKLQAGKRKDPLKRSSSSAKCSG